MSLVKKYKFQKMMRKLPHISFFIAALVNAQNKVDISTIDIIHFWEAFDSLRDSRDSVNTFQRLYIDPATPGLRAFIGARNFTSAEYVRLIKRYPEFWKSIRPNTLAVISRQAELEHIFEQFSDRYPAFNPPKIYFAIGCLRSGGTTKSDFILIGSEIAASDETTDKSEMKGWLKSVIGGTGDIVSMVAHEAVHTQQKITLQYIFQMFSRRLVAQSIREGAADFVSMEIAKTFINKTIYDYGRDHYDELKSEFIENRQSNNLSKWLYNGGNAADRPADLGYFMGYKICEAYYQNSNDKVKALKILMQTRNPKKIFKKSGFSR